MSNLLTALVIALILTACMNMPTPPSQIAGAHNSGIRYEEYGCARLATEWDSLSRRESQLAIAQEQRIKSSQFQAFWWGFGQGDGIEASELSTVRGEIEAVRKVSEVKNVNYLREQIIPHQKQDSSKSFHKKKAGIFPA